MAAVTRATDADIDGSNESVSSQIPELKAGEAIPAAGCPCYIAADGTVRLSNGVAAAAVAAEIRGWSVRAAGVGQPVTLVQGRSGNRFLYAAGLTPGATLFLGAVAGGLDTAVQLGGPAGGVAFALNATDIMTIA